MGEKKLYTIVLSTLFVYGLSSLLQLGSFVMPLPFFESAWILICIFLSTKIWSSNKTLSILYISFGVFQFLGFDYNYNFFLSDEKLEYLSNSICTDVFKILSHLLLIPILHFQKKQNIFSANTRAFLFLATSILICLFLPSPIWILIPVAIILQKLIKTNNLFQFSTSFWLYFPLFILARELSLYFL